MSYNTVVYVEQGGARLVVASGGELDVESGGALKLAGVSVDATALELNRACDVSARLVAVAVDTAITVAAHEGRTLVMGGAGSARTFTLPAAEGTGARFRFLVGAVNTSNYLIKVSDATDTIDGTVLTRSDDSAAVLGYTAGASDDTITLNGTTTGGAAIGDWIELEDIAANQWAVRGVTTSSGSEATPFSNTVS